LPAQRKHLADIPQLAVDALDGRRGAGRPQAKSGIDGEMSRSPGRRRRKAHSVTTSAQALRRAASSLSCAPRERSGGGGGGRGCGSAPAGRCACVAAVWRRASVSFEGRERETAGAAAAHNHGGSGDDEQREKAGGEQPARTLRLTSRRCHRRNRWTVNGLYLSVNFSTFGLLFALRLRMGLQVPSLTLDKVACADGLTQ